MPKLKNAVPKYRKHRASGQAIVTIAGRDHYLGPHNTKASKLEYDRLIAEWLSTGRSRSFGELEAELSIAELLAAYLKHAKQYYGSGSRTEYATMHYATKLLAKIYGRTNANEFGPLQYEALRNRLLESGNSRSYINSTMRRIVRVFRWAASKAMIPESVPRTLALVPGLKRGRTEAPESKPVLPVGESDVQAALSFMPEIVADMVRIQRLTGARPAEVCLLRPVDIDRSSEVWTYRPSSHKTQHHGRDRVIFLGPKAQAILRPYLLREAETHCFSPAESMKKRFEEAHANRKTPLSCGNKPGSNRKKKPKKQPRDSYDTASYRRAIHRACDKAGIARWSPNRLRHSAATEIRKTFGLEAAQVMLGHATADVTQVYAERDEKLAVEVAKKIG